MGKKKSGILLHITSLFSSYGIGDMGPSAYRFTDFLADAGQTLWQILPLNPTDPAHANSPYSSISAFAGNVLFISPELLVRDGFVGANDIKPPFDFPAQRVDYNAVRIYKERILHLSYQNFKAKKKDAAYERFCSLNSYWLDDFALFAAIKAGFDGNMWSDWPRGLRDRDPHALEDAKAKFNERYEKEKFLQYLFSKQWFLLKDYCRKRGISIIGDTPIYVNLDSVDVWKNPEIFKLNKNKRPRFVAGVPPDYFSETGQLWGNPVYNWKALKESGYIWWIQRMMHVLDLYDIVRIDHFRGFVGYWQVPAGEETAINGKWKKAPAQDFFNVMLENFPGLPIIAEDLGIITNDVKKIMKRFGFPGMKVLLFAFGEDNPHHPYLPQTYGENCVVYTGTHDNNTIRGWIRNEAGPEEKERLFKYLGREIPEEELHWELIRLAMASPANMSIIPMQDILGLGETCRMNKPAVTNGNWEWRLLPQQINSDLAKKLRDMTEANGRTCCRYTL